MAMGEVSRTKAVHQRKLADFAAAVGDGILHGSNQVFNFPCIQGVMHPGGQT